MKKIIVIPVTIVVLIGLTIFYYSQQTGEHYSPQVLTHKGPLSAPAITIVDESGMELATGKFEYGWSCVCRYSWRVPDDFKGKYLVKANMDSGPFEIKQEETWHMI